MLLLRHFLNLGGLGSVRRSDLTGVVYWLGQSRFDRPASEGFDMQRAYVSRHAQEWVQGTAKKIGFIVVPEREAPDNYRDLTVAKARYSGLLPVSEAHCDGTIWGTRSNNQAFRAWHDQRHLDNQLTFIPAHEIELGFRQAAEAMAGGLTSNDARLIAADVQGQVAYFNRFGEFPHDQAAFVAAFVNGRWDFETRF